MTASQSHALTFVLNDAGGTAAGTQARRGFEIAAAYWSSVFTDNVTVNLNIGFSALDANVLGSAGSTRAGITMAQGYGALIADRTSALDAQAVANLRPLGTSNLAGFGAVEAIANNFANGTTGLNGYTDVSTRLDNDRSANNSTLAINTASAKALGVTRAFNGATIDYALADASITFSNLFDFDFNPTDGIGSNSFDFIGVAIHEIGHALGFVSGVDSVDRRTSPGQTAAGSLTSLENSIVMSPLDLFRYSSAGNLDWSTQNTPYFSLDGGVSQVFGDSRFSTGVLNGDRRQASHWKDAASGAPQIGILDPTSGRGQLQEVTATDLAAYDAIGWNVNFDVLANSGYKYTTADAYRAFATAVPEPATWGMMILGFGMVGASSRYRRRSGEVAVV
ncbi:NF038122 family metalloprotease [Sphingomonas aliaeris]|uniref:NF038122 family metalloprotease n=1 Tax=Sphingomonas aliaeris TaxID=2759526 RepID=A0A974S5T5_9SPHN|nr:NF038122 family metalloprotease [Sphingomonas aliaeris]